jgi:hypothetical protein
MVCCVFTLQAKQSIIVGNSAPEVKSWAASTHQPHQQQQHPQGHSPQQQQQQQSLAEHGNPQVYAASASIAAGVLEGLQALGFLQH